MKGMVTGMVTEVYGDLLFFINAGMDCLCFQLTARLLRRRISRGRLVIGSVLGGLYAVLALLPTCGHTMALILDLCACVLICLPVFMDKQGGWRQFFPAVGVYLAVSMLLGGVMTGLYNLFNRTGLPGWLSSAGDDGPTVWIFALLALIGGGVTLLCGRLFRRTGAVTPCRVTVGLNGQTVTLDGLVDSGNLLHDPVSGLPVIPVEREAVRAILSPALFRLCADRTAGNTPGGTGIEGMSGSPDARRIRLIPTATATGQSMMIALRVDAVELTLANKSGKGEHTVKADALIAPTGLPRGGDPTRSPQALVPSELAL